ncbi:hypothetical protein CVT25_014636 [Psilocybe cyanescens]|uniref:Uncharacterized protein n=1 Tax=Psilocybe cyanescens TaxID=93625 RepID=A0A409WTY4_PSICY|nr:hypothetical protein CVT25_014636 [Psilocybe cyanescens]
MSSRRTRSPARLIIRRGHTQTRYPPWVYGFFLLPDELIAAKLKLPTPSASERDDQKSPQQESFDRYREVFDDLELQAALQSDAFGWKSMNVGILPCRVDGTQRLVLGLRKCTRPHRDFLLPDNELEVLKGLMAKDGFTKDPTWYRVAVD